MKVRHRDTACISAVYAFYAYLTLLAVKYSKGSAGWKVENYRLGSASDGMEEQKVKFKPKRL
jgi:hypothetical protein